MGAMALTRGDAATLDIEDLQAPDPTTHELVAAQFQANDVLIWTAKAAFGRGDPAAIIQKTSTVVGEITINVGGNSASVSIVAGDWAGIVLNAEQPYEWDLEYRPLGVAANAVTIASGDDLIYPDVSGNALTRTAISGGIVCTPWATHVDALAPRNVGVDVDEMNVAMQIASDWLFIRTRRRYRGSCVDEIRPLAQWRPAEGSARWWNGAGSRYGFCSCHRDDGQWGCSSISAIKLPGYPVHPDSITVTIDGDNFTDFLLLDKRTLVRTDGEAFPCCQDRTLPLTEVGTWGVRYGWGVMPPIGGKRAAAMLGGELYAMFFPNSDSPCLLPQRVTNISRQGVSMAVLDPLTLFADGQTGLPFVDLWVASEDRDVRDRVTLLDPAGGRGRRVTRTR